jgi:hypothetical protein
MKYLSMPYFKRVGLLVALIIIPPIFIFVAFRHTITWVYWTGYALQCPSIVAAAIGFWSMPKILGDTTLWALFLRVVRAPKPTEFAGGGTMGGSGRATLSADVEKLFIEQRIEILEKTASTLAAQINNLSDKHEELKSIISNEERLRSAQDQQIMSRLRLALLDGLPIAAVSILWLVIGIAMSAYGGSPDGGSSFPPVPP